ncbi:hypothetical protein GCM10017559_64970 [Streptosporangium longisporum]|uniref:Uncharacterized protein n=1 Tax=Streptosporangium longisporum TaxID=46187 RepID=A0ABP6L6B1_9ACTN
MGTQPAAEVALEPPHKFVPAALDGPCCTSSQVSYATDAGLPLLTPPGPGKSRVSRHPSAP